MAEETQASSPDDLVERTTTTQERERDWSDLLKGGAPEGVRGR